MELLGFNELFALLQTADETDRIEAKATTAIGPAFLETVSALSNEPELGGGYIILGVAKNETSEDSKYLVTGVANVDKLQQEIITQCAQCFNIPIRPYLKVISHENGNIILVHIPEVEAHEKPVYIQSKGRESGAYRRIGSSDLVCTSVDLDLLYQLRSKLKYDEMQEERASLEDFDPQAIRYYRELRKQVKADASELGYNDLDLLKAINAIRIEKGVTLPTVAGILLFGTQAVLSRLFPMRNHIDYMLIEGREWMSDPDRRYTAVEMCEPLITSIPRLLHHIMSDIALESDGLRRKDNPTIPRKVIRESLINTLMHRDYRVASPVQIIKYTNRIEFRNSGYSLKPQEQLSLPGSMLRNKVIARIFRDINYAESKGTGIRAMQDEMRSARLSIPLIESDRSSNRFVLTLLFHHLCDPNDIDWLKHFKDSNLTDEEAHSLIVAREMGAITNSDYRAINTVDALTASLHLQRLRDRGLLEQKYRGFTFYYVPTKKLLYPENNSLTGKLALENGS